MEEEAQPSAPAKDPKAIARKYQVELCKRAVEENIIVHMGTGGGKTHIAVLLMYEFGHRIRKPNKNVCVFLAPTSPLVRQQAGYIQKTTDFKVRCYYGNLKRTNHEFWSKEMEDIEIFVMTPQILVDKLRHCFIRMELIALLIFDECHHAQLDKRHPYAQIMKEFYMTENGVRPRIFGMTASPMIGNGGSNKLNYARCANSLESLLDAKICTVEQSSELESIVASPDVKVYFYGSVGENFVLFYSKHCKKLEEIKFTCISVSREKAADLNDTKKKIKLLSRVHDALIFCMKEIGFCGAVLASRVLLSGEGFDALPTYSDNCTDNSLAMLYLDRVTSIFNSDPLAGYIHPSYDSCSFENLEEPFFSKKLLLLIHILNEYRDRDNIKCIVFVKRTIIARALALILSKLKGLEFWKCQFLVGLQSKSVSRREMNGVVERFSSGEINLLVATAIAEEGLDIRTCCLVVRFDLPETVSSFIQSRGRARMQKSEYVLLLESGNEVQEKHLEKLMFGENVMNEQITSRSTDETLEIVEEVTYKVETGACVSTGCSVSLLHHYCSKLPGDAYFAPEPKFFFKEDLDGTICTICLPPNCPIRQVEGPPSASKQDAKRAACLKACMELHSRGALTDYLLPLSTKREPESIKVQSNNDSEEVECFTYTKGFHIKVVPEFFTAPIKCTEDRLSFHFYLLDFKPIPADRKYTEFGLFFATPLPKEVENMEIELCLPHRRKVKTALVYSGDLMFDKKMISSALKFQEMFHKLLSDRSKFFPEFVCLEEVDILENSSSISYLFLPIHQNTSSGEIFIDWKTVNCCLSSPVFQSTVLDRKDKSINSSTTLNLLNGPVEKSEIVGSLVFTPHCKKIFFIDGIYYDTNSHSQMKGLKSSTYKEHYIKRFNIDLLHPTQPLLKAKELFYPRNLLYGYIHDSKEVPAYEEHLVELPPELCILKIKGFTKEIGRSLSLFPSIMHRLGNLLVASQLKEHFSTSFPKGSEISTSHILEALTTEKCLEGFSLERLEILGDAFLKYAVTRHGFIVYDSADEGQLSTKRSRVVNNSNLCKLALNKNLQAYIQHLPFSPAIFFNLGPYGKTSQSEVIETEDFRIEGKMLYQCLLEKTIADVVEALIGAFLVDSGFKGACSFLGWLGINVDCKESSVERICQESYKNLSNVALGIDWSAVETLLGYKFRHKGILVQAFTHPSNYRHSGGCYQRLEFLGDAVLDYMITSYYFSSFPDLKPGQLSDLKSTTVNNVSLAQIAISLSLHHFLIQDSPVLMEAIADFETSEKELISDSRCPKVLGDLVESCMGAVLLDSGFDLNCLWKIILRLFDPHLSSSTMQVNPLRELRELCQTCHIELTHPEPVLSEGKFKVEVVINANGKMLTFSAVDRNSKIARTVASRSALSEIKALGFSGKSKKLEEKVHIARKKDPKLIGYDEAPTVFDSMEDLVDDLSSMPSSSRLSSDLVHEKDSTSHQAERIKEGNKESSVSSTATTVRRTPTMRLFEACAVNYWKRPAFSWYEEEGECHRRRFACKVSLEVDVTKGTVIECYGDLKHKKKAAKDHAAEGALWCLTNMGLLSDTTS